MSLRTIPPAAAPVSFGDLLHGFKGIANKTAREKLEREMREFFGVENVFLASSGKAALFLILSGLKRLTGKKKVIIPAYTCFSVPSAVRLAGLEIVPCDVREETLDFDFEQLETLLDDGTMCVVPTHLFGVPSDMVRVRELCGKNGIYVVEDAAQAMGARHRGRKLGTVGDVSFFSLGRGKNLTCGSGGIIVTSSKEIADSIKSCMAEIDDVPACEYLKNILEIVLMIVFLHPNLYWFPKSLPFLGLGETKYSPDFPVWKFTGFKAGLLHDWRRKLEKFNGSRSLASDFYIESLGLSIDKTVYMKGFPYNRFPVFLGNAEWKKKMTVEGDRVGISPMYPSPIHGIPQLAGTFGGSRKEGAEKISATLVTLPTHILLRDRDRIKIRHTVKNGIAGGNRIGSGQPL